MKIDPALLGYSVIDFAPARLWFAVGTKTRTEWITPWVRREEARCLVPRWAWKMPMLLGLELEADVPLGCTIPRFVSASIREVEKIGEGDWDDIVKRLSVHFDVLEMD